MPSRIHALDGRFVKLSDTVLTKVVYLARLAHVTTSDIVNYVLTEMFEGEDKPPAEAIPASLSAPRPRLLSRGPADVIPITRNRRPAPDQPVVSSRDLGYLRLQAADLRRAAQSARAHAVDICSRAERIRDQVRIALDEARKRPGP